MKNDLMSKNFLYVFLTLNHTIHEGSCGGSEFLSNYAVLTSPGYPDSYPPNLACQWVITGGEGQYVQLNFSHIFLEKKYDTLHVYDGYCCNKADLSTSFSGGLLLQQMMLYAGLIQDKELMCNCSNLNGVAVDYAVFILLRRQLSEWNFFLSIIWQDSHTGPGNWWNWRCTWVQCYVQKALHKPQRYNMWVLDKTTLPLWPFTVMITYTQHLHWSKCSSQLYSYRSWKVSITTLSLPHIIYTLSLSIELCHVTENYCTKLFTLDPLSDAHVPLLGALPPHIS